MTWGLLMKRYCVRCETPLNKDERMACADCNPVIGPKPEDSHIICHNCGDAWANDQTALCNPCLEYVEPDNLYAI